MGERYAGRADGTRGSIRLKCGMRTERMRAESQKSSMASEYARRLEALRMALRGFFRVAQSSRPYAWRFRACVRGRHAAGISRSRRQTADCENPAERQASARRRRSAPAQARGWQSARVQSSAHAYCGALRRQQTAILRGKEVAVKAQRERRFGKGAGGDIPMRRALIKLGAGRAAGCSAHGRDQCASCASRRFQNSSALV